MKKLLLTVALFLAFGTVFAQLNAVPKDIAVNGSKARRIIVELNVLQMKISHTNSLLYVGKPNISGAGFTKLTTVEQKKYLTDKVSFVSQLKAKADTLKKCYEKY